MRTIVKTKLLGKYVEIRDYQLFSRPLKVILCTAQDYEKCFHVGEEYQILTLAQQKKGKVVNTQRSKFYPYDYYKIYTFLWKPKGKIQGMQLTKANVRFEGNVAIIE